MKNQKKVLALVLAFCMLVGMTPTAFAAEPSGAAESATETAEGTESTDEQATEAAEVPESTDEQAAEAVEAPESAAESATEAAKVPESTDEQATETSEVLDGTDGQIIEAVEVPGVNRLEGNDTDNQGRKAATEPLYDDDEMVTVMVQVDAPALMDYYNSSAAPISADGSAGSAVAAFISDMVASGVSEELKEEHQTPVLDAIASLDATPYATISANETAAPSLNVVGQWTTLVNAFAVRVPYGQLEAIRQINGVKTAYVQQTYEVPETGSGGGGQPKDRCGLGWLQL